MTGKASLRTKRPNDTGVSYFHTRLLVHILVILCRERNSIASVSSTSDVRVKESCSHSRKVLAINHLLIRKFVKRTHTHTHTHDIPFSQVDLLVCCSFPQCFVGSMSASLRRIRPRCLKDGILFGCNATTFRSKLPDGGRDGSAGTLRKTSKVAGLGPGKGCIIWHPRKSHRHKRACVFI